MALRDVYNSYKGNGYLFQGVAGACLKAAGDIRNESVEAANHANRVLWAAEVEANVDIKAKQIMSSVLQNATISTTLEASTDNDIQFVVNSLIDIFAIGE